MAPRSGAMLDVGWEESEFHRGAGVSSVVAGFSPFFSNIEMRGRVFSRKGAKAQRRKETKRQRGKVWVSSMRSPLSLRLGGFARDHLLPLEIFPQDAGGCARWKHAPPNWKHAPPNYPFAPSVLPGRSAKLFFQSPMKPKSKDSGK